MIQNDLKTVQVITYTAGRDSYGRPNQTVATTRDIQMACYLYQQKQVQDPRYNECELVGLTHDNSITDANIISYNNVKYQIIHLIPSKRWNQVMLKRMK